MGLTAKVDSCAHSACTDHSQSINRLIISDTEMSLYAYRTSFKQSISLNTNGLHGARSFMTTATKTQTTREATMTDAVTPLTAATPGSKNSDVKDNHAVIILLTKHT